jgi:hypothetical protein
MDRPAQKPARQHAGGLIRLSNDIGLSASDNPLSNFFLESFFTLAADGVGPETSASICRQRANDLLVLAPHADSLAA